MEATDLTIDQALEQLSEESLYELLKVIQKRERRMALKVRAGDDPQDLKTLRALRAALDVAHDKKLREV